jgi:hypothetical protein
MPPNYFFRVSLRGEEEEFVPSHEELQREINGLKAAAETATPTD